MGETGGASPKCVTCGGPAGECECWKKAVAPKAAGKRRGPSPTKRTLDALRKAGYIAATVEHWNPHARIRQDLFGFGDVLAIRPGETLLIQATSASNHAARRTKILELDTARAWLEAGNLIAIWSWRMKAARWISRIEAITLDDLPAKPVPIEPQTTLAIA